MSKKRNQGRPNKYPRDRTIRITVTIPSKLEAQLRNLATTSGMSMSEYITRRLLGTQQQA